MNIFLAINIKNFQESQSKKNDDDENESLEQSDGGIKGIGQRSHTLIGGIKRKMSRIVQSRSAREYEEEDVEVRRTRTLN